MFGWLEFGLLARACNLAPSRLGSLDCWRSGFLGAVVRCRSDIRAKVGVNREFNQQRRQRQRKRPLKITIL